MASGAEILISAKDTASGTIKSVQGAFGNLAKDAKNSILTGVGLGAGISAWNMLGRAAGEAVDFVGDAVTAASSLAESQSKVNVVFGESSAEITAWAETAADAFGQSTQQALEAAGTYGNLFQAFGIGREEATKMSTSLVELAADLASFNNTSIDDALEALRSGLSGETEPLKRFGIALNDARMRAVLAEQGVTNLGATLTAEQKAVAAYAIIMQDSALAQGDFERTSEGLANQQRILTANFENLQASIGEGLLPVVTELVGGANDLIYVLDHLSGSAEEAGEGLGFNLLTPIQVGIDALHSIREEMEHTEEVLAASGRTTSNNWIAMGEAIQDSTSTTTSHLSGHWIDAKNTVVKVTAEMLSGLSDSLVDGQTDWQDKWDEYVDIMENDLTAAAEMAEIQGRLTGSELAAGLNSTDPERRAAAEAMKATFEERLIALAGGVPALAQSTGTNYNTALSAWTGAIGVTGSSWATALRAKLQIDLSTGGYNAGVTWTNGFKNSYSYAYSSVSGWLNGLKQLLVGSSPPPEGPLHYIDKGGFNIGEAWADGMTKGMESFQFPSLDGFTSGGFSSGTGSRGGFQSGGFASGLPELRIYLDGRELADSTARWSYYGVSTTGVYPRG